MLIRSNGGDDREAERAVGESSFPVVGAGGPEAAPNPELVERPKRRRFTAEYKLRILNEADACAEQGEVGALLRREGLYSSHLTTWRRQRDEGALHALERKRGRKPADPRDQRIADLTQRAERAESELERARKVIEVQGNVSALLEDLLGAEGAKESTER